MSKKKSLLEIVIRLIIYVITINGHLIFTNHYSISPEGASTIFNINLLLMVLMLAAGWINVTINCVKNTPNNVLVGISGMITATFIALFCWICLINHNNVFSGYLNIVAIYLVLFTMCWTIATKRKIGNSNFGARTGKITMVLILCTLMAALRCVANDSTGSNDQSQKPKISLIEGIGIMFIVVFVVVAVDQGCKLKKSLSNMDKNVKKQQQDPDEPPQNPTNSVPNNGASHDAMTELTYGTGTNQSQDELTFATTKITLEITNGYTLTDISPFSKTNTNLIDKNTDRPYTLFLRGAVFWGSDLKNLPCSNVYSNSAWLKDPTKCAYRVRTWLSTSQVGVGTLTGNERVYSRLTVIDGYLVNPSIIDYAQCLSPTNANYVSDLSYPDRFFPTVQYSSTSTHQKFFQVSLPDSPVE